MTDDHDPAPHRHSTAVPMRWADLDVYQHVNNVVFLSYLQEARIDLLFVQAAQQGADQLAEGVLVYDHDIEYHRPLVLRPEPITVETWVRKIEVSTFTLGYEVADTDADGTRTTYAVATSTMVPFNLARSRPRRVGDAEVEVLSRFLVTDGPQTRPLAQGDGTAADEGPGRTYRYLAAVRWDDLDAYGHVNNVVFAEYLQEARLRLSIEAGLSIEQPHLSTLTVRQQVTYKRPLPLRTTPVDVVCWIDRLGASSYTVRYEVKDDTTLYATASSVQVGVDLTSGRPRPLSEQEHALLGAFRR